MIGKVRVVQREMPEHRCVKVLVANSKGGCGKSTLSTNLSAAFARKGLATTLVDCDIQQTSSFWLRQRDERLPAITGLNGTNVSSKPQLDWQNRIPRNTERVVVDSTGGITPALLDTFIHKVDVIVVPVMPSAIDIHATTEFIKMLFLNSTFRQKPRPLYVVGNRIDKKNRYFHQLNRFLSSLKLDAALLLPNDIAFLRCAEQGAGLSDLKPLKRFQSALDAFEELVERIESHEHR